MNSIIKWIWYYLPKNKVTSKEIEEKISITFPSIPHWIIKEMTWVETRYNVEEWEYSSDLAIKASEIAIEKSWIDKNNIDFLIFASASQDIIEPATANIVQKWLWLKCPVFDVKNACNSFINWLDIADSFIKSWKYKNILVCSWETPSKVIKYDVTNKEEFKKYFAWYTFWDAWSAIVLSETTENKWLLWRFFYSDWNDWDIATIMWWGSRFPQDASKNYFAWNPWLIRDKFISLDNKEFYEWLKYLNWNIEDIKKVFVHQVAMSNFDHLYENLWISKDKFAIILPELWNIASCCLPTSLAISFEKWELEKNDKIVLIWFASWFSYGILFYEV